MNSTINKIMEQLESVKRIKPLVHHITNYVTVNDCANVCLAIGASPVMADDINEVCDIVSISKSLVLNIGTLNKRTVDSMVQAGLKANELGVPVILDPVGAGASGLRNQTAALLMEKIKFNIIRGNLSEIRFLTENHSSTKGVDVSDDDMSECAEDIALCCAHKRGCVVAITGKTDIVSDGKQIISIENGHEMLSGVTGTGCMCSSLIGAFCGANAEPLLSAAAGILCMGIAGELAFEIAGQQGFGGFHVSLINEIGKINGQTIRERAKIHEKTC